jgi:hypothetical protein
MTFSVEILKIIHKSHMAPQRPEMTKAILNKPGGITIFDFKSY